MTLRAAMPPMWNPLLAWTGVALHTGQLFLATAEILTARRRSPLIAARVAPEAPSEGIEAPKVEAVERPRAQVIPIKKPSAAKAFHTKRKNGKRAKRR